MVKDADDYGIIRYYNDNGEIHRDDGPTEILPNGRQVWYNNGEIHRDDGHAVILPNGTKYWYKNGEIHRDNGPAVMFSVSNIEWWFKNGKRHRDNGPAVIHPYGKIEWWLNGQYYRFNEWCELVNISDEDKFELILRYG